MKIIISIFTMLLTMQVNAANYFCLFSSSEGNGSFIIPLDTTGSSIISKKMGNFTIYGIVTATNLSSLKINDKQSGIEVSLDPALNSEQTKVDGRLSFKLQNRTAFIECSLAL